MASFLLDEFTTQLEDQIETQSISESVLDKPNEVEQKLLVSCIPSNRILTQTCVLNLHKSSTLGHMRSRNLDTTPADLSAGMSCNPSLSYSVT